MTRFRTGLVVGKFAPLHRGHEFVIRTACERCEHVIVLSYSAPEFAGCEPEVRAAWLAARFPDTERIVLCASDEPLPPNSAGDDVHRAFTAEVIRRRTGKRIDAIFSSESYGPDFAADLSRRQGATVTHVAVDPGRQRVPISGTALRAEVHRFRHFLAPEVYASFVERVAILGGESTGKSTLALALAQAFGTTHVGEYGRELWEQRGGKLSPDDLIAIASEQVRREDAAVRSAHTHRFVFCDTTPLTTLFYALDLFGRADGTLAGLAARPYDHIILCAADFPFVQDGTRRDGAFRDRQQAWYARQLAHRVHLLLDGDLEARVRRVGEWLAASAASSRAHAAG